MIVTNNIGGNILFLTGLITNRLNNRINRSFREADIDITAEQFSILALLWYREGYNQQELAEALSRDKTTIARVLGNMFDKNLLVKVPNGSDRRSNLVYLTRKGRELQEKCIRITGEYYVKALENISDENLERAVGVLNEIIINIS
jgi:DNA-binding MarR family transcriptional regulator